MFKKSNPSVNFEKVDTLIGKDTKLNGTITAQGTIRIDGSIDGDVIVNGDVIVGETGHVQGNITSNNVYLCGRVNGNITAKSQLHLTDTSKLYGDAEVLSLVIDQGATFEGKSKMIAKANGQSPIKKEEAEIAATKDKK